MTPKFTIAADPLLDLIQIEMSGFFEEADIILFESARNDAQGQLRCRANKHITLLDIRSMSIQSQKAITHFKRILDNPVYRSKRTAIVVSRTLTRMQIQRAAADCRVTYFGDNLTAAREWLLQSRGFEL